MKRRLANAATTVVATLLVVAVFEVLLRLWPAIISQAILVNFDRPLRSEIAALLDLPLKQERRCIPPHERSDAGPELCLIAPNTQYRKPVDAPDLAAGAQVVVPHDAQGFCNASEKAARPRAGIVSVGNSFTWCTIVAPAATFTARLETMVAETTYNLGVPGVGPYEYLEILRRFGLALEPRLVLFNIYEGNDLRDAARFAEQLARGGSAPQGAQGSSDEAAVGLLGDLLSRHSYAFNFIGGSIEHLAKQWDPARIDFRYRIRTGDGEILMNAGQGDHDEVKYARRLRRGETSPSLWDRALEDFAALAEAHDFIPVVTYIPAAYTAGAATVVFMEPSIGADLAAISRTQRAYLRHVCQAHGLTFIDLTEPLQAAQADSALAYFPYNLHLTPAGHQIVAAALAPIVREQLATQHKAPDT